MENSPHLAAAEASRFRTTHWSQVLQAGSSTGVGRVALESLCRDYWYPLYAFIRRRGHSPEEAEDLTQGFFAHLLAGERLSGVNPAKGRFRTFLLASLKHHLADEWDKTTRLKRGGNREFLSWDALEPEASFALEPASDAPDEVQFDRQWAWTLITGVLARLRQEAIRDGTVARFDVLKAFLVTDNPAGGYAAAVAKLGLSEPAVKSAIHRLRRSYAEALREVIAHTVSSPDEVEAEIRHLFAALAA